MTLRTFLDTLIRLLAAGTLAGVVLLLVRVGLIFLGWEALSR